jgi:hypothetical protein
MYVEIDLGRISNIALIVRLSFEQARNQRCYEQHR